MTGNNAVSKGTAADDQLDSDAAGAYLQNDYNATAFKIAGGPNENAGPGGEDDSVEEYEAAHNTFGPEASAADQRVYALQAGTAGFTNASSCPTAPPG
jgi:hypothetical protein